MSGTCELELARYLSGLPPAARHDARKAFRVGWHAAWSALAEATEQSVRELTEELENEQGRTTELEIENDRLRQQHRNEGAR